MAFSGLGSSNGGTRRGRWSGRGGSISEMNIVPMVDVMLVLLVIFMLTASTMEFGLKIQAPAVRQVTSSAEDLPVISVTKKGDIYLGDKQINVNNIGKEVKAKYKDAKEVYLKGDRVTSWESMAHVMYEATQAKLGIKAVLRVDDSKR